jgi:hypothetical protein
VFPTDSVVAELSADDGATGFASAEGLAGAFVPAWGGGTGLPLRSDVVEVGAAALAFGAEVVDRVESAGFAVVPVPLVVAVVPFGAGAAALVAVVAAPFVGAAFPLVGPAGFAAAVVPLAGVVPGVVAVMTGALVTGTESRRTAGSCPAASAAAVRAPDFAAASRAFWIGRVMLGRCAAAWVATPARRTSESTRERITDLLPARAAWCGRRRCESPCPPGSASRPSTTCE